MSAQPMEAHELRAAHRREIDRIEKEFNARMRRNLEHAELHGYNLGRAENRFGTLFFGAVIGATLAHFVPWGSVVRAVAAFLHLA